MIELQWSEELQCGISEIDADNQKVIDWLNRMHLIMRGDLPDAGIKTILDEMQKHFKNLDAENALMQKAGFPDKKIHEESHLEFKELIPAFLKAYQSNDSALPVKLMLFLSNWVSFHIRSLDKQFGNFLRS